jgi:peptide/nickel transport system permease protein
LKYSYPVKRIVRSLIVVLIVTFLVKLLLGMARGSVANIILGENATPQSIAELESKLGLDQSIWSQYWNWLTNAVSGDFGKSLTTGQSVIGAIIERVPVTLELAFLGLVIALFVSVPLAVLSAYYADSIIDRSINAVSSMLLSIPAYVAAPILLYIFSIQMRILPASGWARMSDGLGANLQSAILPATAIALPVIASFHRILRSDLMSTMSEEYIDAAKAKGLPAVYIMFRHVLRPSSLSLITVAGINLGQLIGGTVIVETLFALPGLGQLIATSITSRDLIMVQGVVVFVAIAYVAINTIVDLSYSWLDPRVRDSSRLA